jgi:hypothetical protein
MMDLIAFPDNSRVWIFQGNRPVPDHLLSRVHKSIQDFTASWTSHQNELAATGSILHHRFIVLVVDEARAGVSGCSIDKAVHFVQGLGHHLSIDFFDRHAYSYIQDDEVFTVTAEKLNELYSKEEIGDNTLVFDNLVNNKKDFQDNWLKPIGSSWIKRVVLS